MYGRPSLSSTLKNESSFAGCLKRSFAREEDNLWVGYLELGLAIAASGVFEPEPLFGTEWVNTFLDAAFYPGFSTEFRNTWREHVATRARSDDRTEPFALL